MAMPIASIEIPSATNNAPVQALVARKIIAAPNRISSMAKMRLIVCLFDIRNFNASNERALSSHQRHDLPLVHPDKRDARLLLSLEQGGCRLLLST